MRGGDERSGALFSYVDLEARVRREHPLRRIRRRWSGTWRRCIRRRGGLRSRRKSCCERCCYRRSSRSARSGFAQDLSWEFYRGTAREFHDETLPKEAHKVAHSARCEGRNSAPCASPTTSWPRCGKKGMAAIAGKYRSGGGLYMPVDAQFGRADINVLIKGAGVAGLTAAYEGIAYARTPRKLPVVLSADEVVGFLQAMKGTRNRVALMATYAWAYAPRRRRVCR